jgi:hypothetical protein
MKLIYDQGTLIATDAPEDLLNHCPDFLWDPRVEVFRAPAFKYAHIKQGLESLQMNLPQLTVADQVLQTKRREWEHFRIVRNGQASTIRKLIESFPIISQKEIILGLNSILMNF